jgi:hypothetical protein
LLTASSNKVNILTFPTSKNVFPLFLEKGKLINCNVSISFLTTYFNRPDIKHDDVLNDFASVKNNSDTDIAFHRPSIQQKENPEVDALLNSM